jgi:hypothetical protein
MMIKEQKSFQIRFGSYCLRLFLFTLLYLDFFLYLDYDFQSKYKQRCPVYFKNIQIIKIFYKK